MYRDIKRPGKYMRKHIIVYFPLDLLADSVNYVSSAVSVPVVEIRCL